MELINLIRSRNNVLSAPLIGYPTARKIGATVEDGVKNANIQTAALLKYYKDAQPDVIFPFMDLSVEAEALGLRVDFARDDGPSVTEHPLRKPGDLKNFSVPSGPQAGRYGVYIETVKRLKDETGGIVGAYVASPFTLAGLLMSVEQLAMNTLLEVDFSHEVLDFSCRVGIPYAQAQIDAGADFIILLEPTAALLSPELYENFVGPYVQRVIDVLQVPVVLHVCGQTTKLIPSFLKNDVQGLSLDSDVNLAEVALMIPDNVVIIGNLHPVDVMLQSDAESVYRSTQTLLDQMKQHGNFMASTGCDVPPGTQWDNLIAFSRAVRDYS